MLNIPIFALKFQKRQSTLQQSKFISSFHIYRKWPVNFVRLRKYRSITVILALSKLIKEIIHNQLSQYLEANGVMCPHQFGFRQGRSMQHAVAYLSKKIRQDIDKGLFSGTVYIVLRKAFDAVRHATLL